MDDLSWNNRSIRNLHRPLLGPTRGHCYGHGYNYYQSLRFCIGDSCHHINTSDVEHRAIDGYAEGRIFFGLHCQCGWDHKYFCQLVDSGPAWGLNLSWFHEWPNLHCACTCFHP